MKKQKKKIGNIERGFACMNLKMLAVKKEMRLAKSIAITIFLFDFFRNEGVNICLVSGVRCRAPEENIKSLLTWEKILSVGFYAYFFE